MTTYTTESGKYVIRDANGEVIGKADVPPGEHPLPDNADSSMCVEVTDDTPASDLERHLEKSPANLPDAATDNMDAFEKLEQVQIDNTYRGP